MGSNSITVADADNVNAGIASYPTSGAKIWNVEDTDTIFETSFQLNDKVALVLDEDYKVQTGFVYDRLDGEMIAKPTTASTMTESAGTLDDADGTALGTAGELSVLRDGGTIYWNGATASATLKFQPVLTSATMGGTVSAKYSIDGAADADYVYANGIVITASATGNDVNTTHEIKLTISEKDNNGNSLLNDCVITYTVVINGVKATEPTVALVDVAGNGTLTGAATLTAGETAEASIANAVIGAKSVAFTIADNGGTSTAKLDGVDYTSNTPVFVTAGKHTYTLEVTVTESNKVTATYTYKVELTVAQDEAAAGTWTLASDSTNGKGATITEGTPTLSATTTATLTGFTAGSTDEVKITFAPTGSETIKSATLQAPDGSLKAYASGDTIAVSATADGSTVSTYKLTVVTSETGKTDKTVTYTINFTASNP